MRASQGHVLLFLVKYFTLFYLCKIFFKLPILLYSIVFYSILVSLFDIVSEDGIKRSLLYIIMCMIVYVTNKVDLIW